jgi:CheY-like chemotaxis protein
MTPAIHPHSGTRVLVVAARPVSRAALVTTLSKAGYEVDCVNDGAEAFATARSWHPAAIIGPIATPGLDGSALVARLRVHGDGTPVILMGREAAGRRSSPGVRFVGCPCTSAELLVTVGRATGGTGELHSPDE